MLHLMLLWYFPGMSVLHVLAGWFFTVLMKGCLGHVAPWNRRCGGDGWGLVRFAERSSEPAVSTLHVFLGSCDLVHLSPQGGFTTHLGFATLGGSFWTGLRGSIDLRSAPWSGYL